LTPAGGARVTIHGWYDLAAIPLSGSSLDETNDAKGWIAEFPLFRLAKEGALVRRKGDDF
jgi:hypothetical protein